MTVSEDATAQQSSLDLDGVRAAVERQLLWVDPDRDLVIASHRGDRVAEPITEVSAAVPVTAGR